MTSSGISEAAGHEARHRKQIAVAVVAALVVLVGSIGAGVRSMRAVPLDAAALAVPAAHPSSTSPPPALTPQPGTVGPATSTSPRPGPSTSHTHMTMRISSGSEESGTITFDLDSDPANHRVSMVESSDLFDRDIKVVTVGDSAYLLRADGSWARVRLSTAIRDRALAAIGPGDSSLDTLRHMGAVLQNKGRSQARVDGVPTTRWSGRLDMEKFLRASATITGLDPDSPDIREAGRSSEGTATAYIDDAQRMRRMTLDVTIRPPDGSSLHLHEESRTSNWGKPVHIDPPDAADVTLDEHADTFDDWIRIISKELDTQTA